MAAARAYRLPVLLLAASLLLHAVFLLTNVYYFNPYDEGIAAVGAMRVLGGDLPYRDFWTVYPPGQFYLLALVYRLVGPSLLAGRLVDALFRVLAELAVFVAVRRLAGTRPAVVAWLGAVLLLGSLHHFTYPVFPALGLALTALAARDRPVQAGLLVGLAALFRIELALAAAGGIGLPMVTMRTDLRCRLRAAGSFACAALAPGVLALALLLTAVPVADLWDQLIVFPFTQLPAYRWLPYPGMADPGPLAGMTTPVAQLFGRWVPFYFPLAAVVASTVALARQRALLPFLVFGALTFGQELGRADRVHTAATTAAAVVVLAVLLRRAPWPLLLVLALLPSSYELSLALPKLPYAPALLAPCFSYVERARCVGVPADEVAAVQTVRANSPPGEPIFVGLARSDVAYINDLLLYFLADRTPATKYAELHPGVATTAAVQQAIVDELDRKGVRLVVTVDSWSDADEPNRSAASSGVTLLDDYVRDRYAAFDKLGDDTFWRRR